MEKLQTYKIESQIPQVKWYGGIEYKFQVVNMTDNSNRVLTVGYKDIYIQYTSYQTTFNGRPEEFSSIIGVNNGVVDASIISTDHYGNVKAEYMLITPFGNANRFNPQKETLWSFLNPKDDFMSSF